MAVQHKTRGDARLDAAASVQIGYVLQQVPRRIGLSVAVLAQVHTDQ